MGDWTVSQEEDFAPSLIPSDDGSLPPRRRSQGERIAYQDGYIMGLKVARDTAERRLDSAKTMRQIILDDA